MKNTRSVANNNNTNARFNNNFQRGGRPNNNGPRAGGNANYAPAPMPTSPCLEALDGLNVSPTATIPLIDPTGFGGLIQVPVTKTFDTKGRSEFFKGILTKEVSLCCLFQKGRCHAGDKCHQVHVDTTFIKNVRAQNAHVVSCCRACKDTASLSPSAVAFFAAHCDKPTIKIMAQDGRYSVVSSENVAITTGLTQHVEQQQLQSIISLPVKKMCRLHLRGNCKYGKDCKNVHLCTKLTESILTPNTTPTPEERSSAKSSRTPTPTPATQHGRSASGIMDRNSSSSSMINRNSHVDNISSRRNSTSSSVEIVDAPKDYFSSSRFSTPPPRSLSQSISATEETPSVILSPPAASTAADAPVEKLSFSQVDLSNVSFMENSVAMAGLCFDPKMALNAWDEYDGCVSSGACNGKQHQPKTLSAEWFHDDCGMSSTASQKSATPTPNKTAFW